MARLNEKLLLVFFFFLRICFIFGCPGSLSLQMLFLVVVYGLLTAVSSLVIEHGPWGSRLSSCDMGLVAPWHVESSQTRDRICVPCRWINHWTTREVYSWYLIASLCRT